MQGTDCVVVQTLTVTSAEYWGSEIAGSGPISRPVKTTQACPFRNSHGFHIRFSSRIRVRFPAKCPSHAGGLVLSQLTLHPVKFSTQFHGPCLFGTGFSRRVHLKCQLVARVNPGARYVLSNPAATIVLGLPGFEG